MKSIFTKSLLVFAVVTSLSACANMSQRQTNTAAGYGVVITLILALGAVDYTQSLY